MRKLFFCEAVLFIGISAIAQESAKQAPDSTPIEEFGNLIISGLQSMLGMETGTVWDNLWIPTPGSLGMMKASNSLKLLRAANQVTVTPRQAREVLQKLIIIGKQSKSNRYIIEVTGSSQLNAKIFFNTMTQHMKKTITRLPEGKLIVAEVPGGGTITFRNFSTKSGTKTHSTIQIAKMEGINIKKIKFNN